jgi:uronate dehydrogenase
MYWDKHGIEGISIRIGSCLPRPMEFRHLSTWLGHQDFFHMIDQCLTVPDIGYVAVWGISDNTRKYCNFGEGEKRLGYTPKQDSEQYAAEILQQKNPLDPIAQQHQGGAFVTQDFTPAERRVRRS